MNETKTTKYPETETLKTKLKEIWSAGNFEQIAQAYLPDAAEFIEGLNLKPGEKVLDVGCGAGSSAIPAARIGADVTGIDIAANLIEQARKNAEAEGLNCRFEEGDAEAIRFEDESFDTVISMFGAMFAPRPEKVAGELIRVCRKGGRIVMANWTPEGFIGQMFKINARYIPPPNIPSAILWGDEKIVSERFSKDVSELKMNRRMMIFDFPFSPTEVVEHYRTYFGPTQNAFNTLENDKEKQTAFRRDLENHWAENNLATDGTTKVESEYLEVIARRE